MQWAETLSSWLMQVDRNTISHRCVCCPRRGLCRRPWNEFLWRLKCSSPPLAQRRARSHQWTRKTCHKTSCNTTYKQDKVTRRFFKASDLSISTINISSRSNNHVVKMYQRIFGHFNAKHDRETDKWKAFTFACVVQRLMLVSQVCMCCHGGNGPQPIENGLWKPTFWPRLTSWAFGHWHNVIGGHPTGQPPHPPGSIHDCLLNIFSWISFSNLIRFNTYLFNA